jgi:flagellar transcriptional activator FlhD
MTNEQILSEIRDANLTYLMLAQKLIREDRREALSRLGISEEAAGIVGLLSMGQMLKIASSNMLLCRFRIDDEVVWGLLTNHKVGRVDKDASARLRASLQLAERYAETV